MTETEMKMPLDYSEMTYEDGGVDGGLSDWAIAGIVVGSVVAACVIGGITTKILMSRAGSAAGMDIAAVPEMPVVKMGCIVQKRYPFGLKPKAQPFGLNNFTEL